MLTAVAARRAAAQCLPVSDDLAVLEAEIAS